jgi:hypothetical protein
MTLLLVLASIENSAIAMILAARGEAGFTYKVHKILST